MNGLRTTATWVLGLATTLVLTGPEAWAQSTSRFAIPASADAALDNASADSAANGGTPDNASSPRYDGWHPARPNIGPCSVPARAFSEDNVARPIQSAARPIQSTPRLIPSAALPASTGSESSDLNGPSLSAAMESSGELDPTPAFSESLDMRVGGAYLPAWQRSPNAMRAPTSGRKTAARRVSHNVPTVAQPLNGTSPSPAPFVEDELVPTPQHGTNMDLDNGVTFQNQPAVAAIDSCAQCGGAGPCNALGMCTQCCPCDPMACERFHVCGPLAFLNELGLMAGTQGFKGPVDQGANGNFGLDVGFNFGDALWHHKGIGYQFGGQVIESDFNGSQADGFSSGARTQVFATAGLFHRAFYNYGWQGGAVVDYLNDHYYFNATTYQIRAELSYVGYNGHEIGVASTTRSRSANLTVDGVTQTYQPINMYSAFYRWNFKTGSFFRIRVGDTGPIGVGFGNATNSVMFGADYRMVLNNRIDFVGNFTYLCPTQTGIVGQEQEAWGLNMNLVFYPARFAGGSHNGPYRPLFNVADPSSFILGRLIP